MVFEKLKEIFGRVMPQCDPATIKWTVFLQQI